MIKDNNTNLSVEKRCTKCKCIKTRYIYIKNDYIPLDKLLPQGLQDILNVYHEYMAQSNDIYNEIINTNENTTLTIKK